MFEPPARVPAFSPDTVQRLLDGDVRAVLFDLDGTLADTAPDLVAAVNKVRTDRGLPPGPYETLRLQASHGARGLIGSAFGVGPDDAAFPSLRDAFLANYEAALCVQSRLFDGIPALLAALAERGMPWGIVTNKAARLTNPLVKLLGLNDGAACVVSGDTTPHSKPHPAPLLYAAECIRISPAQIVYVGDDLRDIQAGKAAGMATVAAAYGYCGDSLAPAQWQADAVVECAGAIAPLVMSPV
ncbi:HAD-IA family hydrolase [Pandoraea apista]|uniref:phosphoglycolate phosphatase n=1 Tax=Pandoraea apista TaxID=93218 RepID=A0A0G4JIC5_9BURK|nr:HAD-IA family hydrolase [Pandoraea apista]AVF40252.1 phosphoglycolate phosphatase [Pandoraea apista]OXS89876.1 phosphoglycolate phosphatase [Pandoraea apista]PTE02797.1 phosphoglycolate phosphatase [Pandoraea apista]RRJ29092.1 HAD family hydrolase [Pandoraea apista]RRJ81123.1 HAD family hydrolase [Pandoraea apista]